MILGLGVLGITVVLTRAVVIGEIPVPRKHSSEIVTWAKDQGRFIRLFAVWTVAEVACAFGMKILANRVKDLRQP